MVDLIEHLIDQRRGRVMRKIAKYFGASALGAATILSLAPVSRAGDKADTLPGPIDSFSDLQDSAKILFKMADTNNDGQISQKEATDVGNLLVGGFFFRADTNGDGTLSPDEARQARETLFNQQPLLRYVLTKAKPPTPSASTEPAGSPAQVAQSIAANPMQAIGNLLDTNHDQKIEAPELRQAVQTGVQLLFASADTNQDGQLSPAELNNVVGEAAKAVVQTAFQAADTDHNGAISVGEFDKALTEPAHAAFRVFDGNNDGQISIQELQQAERIIFDQIRRLRVPEAPNSVPNQLRAAGLSGSTTTNSSTAPAPAQVAPPQR
jgi:Ca2+-binding EF-hand superfamily protein